MITGKAEDLRTKFEKVYEDYDDPNWIENCRKASIEICKEVAHNCKPTKDEFCKLMERTTLDVEGFYYLIYERREVRK